MKICFIGDVRSIHLKIWVEWFAKRGHEIHIISYQDPIKMENVIIHKIKSLGKNKFLKLINFVLSIPKVRKLIRQIQPDILHGHFLLTYGLLGALSGYRPYITTPWGDDIGEHAEHSPIKRTLDKFVIKKSDLINVCDTFCKERLIELGARSDKIFVNQWGTNINLFKPNKNSKVKKKLRIDDYFSIVITRIPNPPKFLGFFLQAVLLILKQVRKVKFIIVGERLEYPSLKKAVNALGISNAFLFVGQQPPEKVAEIMAGSDIYLDLLKRSVKGNAIGSSIQEAMACGIPVVLGRIPSAAIIEKGYNGVVFDWKDPSELATKIINLHKDKKMREKIGYKARKFAEKNFDREKNLLKMEKLYYKIQKSGKFK